MFGIGRDRSAARVARRQGFTSLPLIFSLYWTLMAGFWTLLCARGYQVPPAAEMRQVLGIDWRFPLSHGTHLALFASFGAALVFAWFASAREAARTPITLPRVLAGTVLLAIPFVFLTGIYSDDVYLYHLYGREIVLHGANPIVTPPSAFPDDPHLKWVYWKWLPSAYGPLWLLLSAPLSAAAGGSITGALIVYRVAGLLAHLATTWIIWRSLRPAGDRAAISAAVFFAWNPFLLFESVASAHNDALMLVAICGAVWAWRVRRVRAAGMLIACAVMVKPFAGLFVLPFLFATWRRDGVREAVVVSGLGIVTALVLFVPFWSGDALLRNILQNPASGVYMNTLWEFAVVWITGTWAVPRTWLEAAVVDPIRIVVLITFVVAAGIVAMRTRDVVAPGLVLWTGFCASQAWLWPWYFMPIVALAAFANGRLNTVAAAISLGGLVFYVGWPPPGKALSWVYQWRSVFLFGPVIVALILGRLKPAPTEAPAPTESPGPYRTGA